MKGALISSPQQLRAQLANAYKSSGSRLYGGERVTQLAHALQSAELAQRSGESKALIIASLLHDYGHFFESGFDAALQSTIDGRHEAIGAKRLSRWLVAAVTEPIRLHVMAKRYLCRREQAYFESLSAASIHSLALQGGPMTEHEAASFEMEPFWEEAVRLRRIDDRAKDPELSTDRLDRFLELIDADLLLTDACAGQ